VYRLARDRSYRVCAAVAGRDGLPQDVLDVLLAHRYPQVRFKLAWNPHLSTDVLARLACDSDERVCATVALHPNLTVDIIELLLWHPCSIVRQRLAGHRSLSLAQQAVLCIDADHTVRATALEYANGKGRGHAVCCLGWNNLRNLCMPNSIR